MCHSFLDRPGERVICRSCREKLRPSGESFCPICGRFFDGAGEVHLCLECLDRRPPFTRHRSCARYSGAVKDIILLFKYHGFEVLGMELGEFLCRSLAAEDDLWLGVDAVIPVPLHRRRRKARGFNQAEILAARIAGARKIELLKRRLVKIRNTPPQTTLEGRERDQNVRGAYRVRRARDLVGRTVLLVDDVYTTGSTIRECSLVLKRAGVAEVRAVTVARA
jgi:ComF family protein